jgi:hypothetical protein
LLGWKKDATAFEIGAKRLQNMSPLGLNQLNAYHHHFATRALHGIGGKVWEDWETRLVEQLIARQERGADGGSWPAAGDTFGAPGGRLYVTTLSLLSLQHFGQLEPPKELRELKDAEVANYWEEMRGVSMAKARRAMNALIAAPNQAVPFLQKNLRPAVAADAKKTDAFIKDLGSAVFQTRMRAFEELKTLAEGAIPYLRKALKADPDVELRRRVEDLLELAAQKAQSPDRLREMRAVQILELIGTAEARELLDAVAQGAADIGVTRAASDALERLGKK